MSISAFCRRAGVSRTQLYQWFKSPRLQIRPDLLWAMLDTLGLSATASEHGHVRSGKAGESASIPLSFAEIYFSSNIVENLMKQKGVRGFIRTPAPHEAVPLRLSTDAPEVDDMLSRDIARRISTFPIFVPAGGWSDCPDGYVRGDSDGFVYVPDDAPVDAFALTIRGDSMTPRFWDGAKIVFVPLNNSRQAYKAGKPHFFYDGNGRCTFKNVFWEQRRQRWRLESENTKYPPLSVEHNEKVSLAAAISMVVTV